MPTNLTSDVKEQGLIPYVFKHLVIPSKKWKLHGLSNIEVIYNCVGKKSIRFIF